MQRQQERARPNRPRRRRTVGELLAAWLVLLWGVGTGGAILPFALIALREGLATFPLPLLLTNLFVLLQGALCIVSGLCVFLRLHLFAKYGLIAVAFCFLGLATMTVWLTKGISGVWDLLWSAVFVSVAVFLFLLGRWLGQQEESGEP